MVKHEEIFAEKNYSEKKRFTYLVQDSELYKKIFNNKTTRTLPIEEEDRISMQVLEINLPIKEEYSEEDLQCIVDAANSAHINHDFIELESKLGKTQPCLITKDDKTNTFVKIHFVTVFQPV